MASTSAGPSIPLPVFYKRFGQTEACPVAKIESPARAVTRQFTSSNPSRKPIVKRKREADTEPSDRQAKVKKEDREELVNRKHWLFEHRALFEPLLPQRANSYITNLVKEMEGETPQSSPRRDFVVQPDAIVGGEMKPYQLAGLAFLAYMYHNGINCILGDEMGLGKTLQTLSLFAHIKETAKSHQPHLIVCPLSVLSSWEAECRRWLPSMHLVRFHGTPGERERVKGLMRENHDIDIVLTTYEMLATGDLSWLKTRHFDCVVLDEGHRIKNSEAEVAKHAASLGGQWRIILTGTPIQNNLVELWGLLHWLYPLIFTQTTRALQGSYALPVLNAVRALLGAIQLRRTKSGLAGSGDLGGVPPREDYTVFIPFTEAQRFWTYRMLTRLDKVDLEVLFPRKKDEGNDDDERRDALSHLETHTKASANQWKNFSMLLMQLRRICDHPYMIDDAQPDAYEIGEHVVAASSKLLAIDKILADVLPKGERVLIFSQWTDMLDLLEDHMVLRDIPYVRLDGSVSRARREMVIRMFQHSDSPYKVFLISTKAGGLGINLTQASVCILCDSDWNPQNDLQAIARAHRIGQTRVVRVYRLVCRASVEDQMLDRIRRKLFLSAKIIGLEAGGGGGGGDGGGEGESGPQGGVGGSELMSILRRGSSALTRSDDDMDITQFRAASLREILEVSEARTTVHDARVKHELKIEDAPEEVLKSAEEEERELLSGVARVQSYLFEGTMLERTKEKDESISVILGKRERQDRIVQYGGMSFIRDDSMQEMMKSKSNAPPGKVKRIPYESEDYCIACRDGGNVVMCNSCPRVFHAECHSTLTAAQVHAANFAQCPQHKCRKCERGTAAAGGLLLRCQTCPQAFCTDCVCWEDIKLVGDVIPEFVLRKFGKKDGAHYIRCADCCEQAKLDPKWAEDWEREIAEAKRLVGLDSM
ncbi:P-loop containing nucleoside triphosphate hydrolase protein [Mycena metata]|uniref:P-loop containing nucleoside triphosphate hydrolase protein n=1 Tax=Mycena metata TaxID=1033252 RepID=A0AAD7NDK8_9AGAR|nr:P-loop containing nucleoside triphosphate hydrolase protein [Mycena metata]